MALSAVEKLRRFYEQFSGDDQVLIVINADPDALASALAVKRLLWRKTAGVAISNINTIKRPDNLTMIQRLGIALEPVGAIEQAAYSKFVMVDSQPSHSEAFKPFDFQVVIDHHPLTCQDAAFRDIRPKYGATATILTEYLRAAKIKPSAKLATGLFYAIKTDTNNFERETLLEDVRAFQFLYRHANIHLVRKIEQAEIRPDFLKYYKTAIDVMRRRKGRAFAHLGWVVSPDVLVQIADFCLKISSVDWSIVSGIHGGKLVIILRNDGLRKNAGLTASNSFGALGSAGGHKSAARAEIDVANLPEALDPKDDQRVQRWIIRQMSPAGKPKSS
jgi:nanoRNase/pAp phosphatase (c-di-AMP/oligoRNAs hydrolase)